MSEMATLPSGLEALSPLRLLTTEDVAALLQVTPKCLKNWRTRRANGPPWVPVGSLVRYRLGDVQQWIANQVTNCEMQT